MIMRSGSRALASLVALVLVGAGTACGATAEESPAVAVDDDGPMPLRVRGSVEQRDGRWRICPAGEPPCWWIDAGGDMALAPGPAMVAQGTLRGDTLAIDEAPTKRPSGYEFPNPCGEAASPGAVVTPAVRQYLDSIPDAYAGEWVVQNAAGRVVAVAGDASRHGEEIIRLGGAGICVTDAGFRFSLADLLTVADAASARGQDWRAEGWTLGPSNVSVRDNRVELWFDQLDQRLVHEIEQTRGGRVVSEAVIEVLEGTVQDLPAPPSGPDDIPIATQRRGGGGMQALGHFTLRYDADRDCVWLEGGGPGRTAALWRHGMRALRNPVRIVDGDGDLVVRVDESFEAGGGGGRTPAPDDPLACGATGTWVMAQR